MSTSLRPLLLPQLVEERRSAEDYYPNLEDGLPYTSHTTNSSSSDIVSPITPTFSARGHFRGSSSTSSLDLAYNQIQEIPSSPPQQLSKQPSKRQLPDVEEEPLDREEDRTAVADCFGLYSCLCDEPCEHGKSAGQGFSGDLVSDYDFDYDIGCLSDEDFSASRPPRRHDSSDSPFLGLTSRLGSRFNTMQRWKPSRKTNLMSSPTTEVSFENVLSRGRSSRSSSISSPNRHLPDRSQELPSLTIPSMSRYNSIGSIDSLCEAYGVHADNRTALERDRAKATTPLLPPLMTESLSQPPPESPLQSPTMAPSSAATEVQQAPAAPVNFSRPSLSNRPSVSSLRQQGFNGMELPLPLPAILQEHDEWSDRLGHANFTITPQPYELEKVDSETITKFRSDWETARVNYTKHLVRAGENYGQTSKIYGLTEAKWAEIEGRWKTSYEGAIKQANPNTCSDGYMVASRSRSRGRGRGRSGSASASIMGRPANDDFFAEMQWQRIEDNLPSAVPRMLDAEGKFPARGDEDIVGPMHRAETMARWHSEEKHGAKFWKNLAEKVGLLK